MNVTREDFKRLYPDEYEKLKDLSELDDQLADLEQPPELGMASEDDFKRVMLEPFLNQNGFILPNFCRFPIPPHRDKN